MVNSVKYFNEVCIKKFLEFEDKFIEKPTDIASYVINVKETLEELGVRNNSGNIRRTGSDDKG